MNIQKIVAKILGHRYRNPRPGLNGLDDKLDKYLNFNNGFFIEAGGNDGYSQSNTYFLETKRNWRGVLIEGIPELYLKCKKARPKSIVENFALVSNDYKHPAVTMHFANLMSVVNGSLKTSDEQQKHIEAGIAVQNLQGTYSIDVPARTLESVLDKIPRLPTINFFSLDVEGCELDVLKGLNLSKYRPKYILVEARFFDEVDSYLQAHGYEMLEQLTFHDYLYKTGSAP